MVKDSASHHATLDKIVDIEGGGGRGGQGPTVSRSLLIQQWTIKSLETRIQVGIHLMLCNPLHLP